MEPAAPCGGDIQHLKGIIGIIHLPLPGIQSRLCDLPGLLHFPKVKHGLPEKPLMGKPHVPVPVSVWLVVAGGHIHGADAHLGKHLLFRKNMTEKPLLLLFAADPGNQRINAVHSF